MQYRMVNTSIKHSKPNQTPQFLTHRYVLGGLRLAEVKQLAQGPTKGQDLSPILSDSRACRLVMIRERKGAGTKHKATGERRTWGKEWNRVTHCPSLPHEYLSVVKQLIQKQVVSKHPMWEGQGMAQQKFMALSM